MSVFKNLWLASLASLICVGLVVWFENQQITERKISFVESDKTHCSTLPKFTVGYQRDPNGVLPDGEGFAFKGVSWLEARLCTPGQLNLVVQGQEAGGEMPRLYVILNSQELAHVAVSHQVKTLSLKIPEAGLLQLAYLNDYYRSEVRAAVLEEIKLIQSSCAGITVEQLPPNTGEGWASSTVFTSSSTLTLKPCGSGQLQFKLVGRSGAGAFPVMSIRQNQILIKAITAAETRQLVRVPVTSQPVSITLTNPYFKEVADRNLFIRQLSFQAAATSP